MTRFLFIIFLAVSFVACKPGVPENIIQPEQMEKILFDIHVLDGYVSEIPSADSAKKVTSPVYKGIFKKYETDSATNAKSMAYYYSRPDLLTKMYDNITARLEKVKNAEIEKRNPIVEVKDMEEELPVKQ